MNLNTLITLENIEMTFNALVLVLVIESLFHYLSTKNKKQSKQKNQEKH